MYSNSERKKNKNKHFGVNDSMDLLSGECLEYFLHIPRFSLRPPPWLGTSGKLQLFFVRYDVIV